jgi:hypothetical protein
MATVLAKQTVDNFGVAVVTWVLATGDIGAPVAMANYSDKTIQSSGDLTSSAVQGSNDNVNYGALNDLGGVAISLVGNSAPITIRENPRYIRPGIAVGGTAGTITMVAKAIGR